MQNLSALLHISLCVTWILIGFPTIYLNLFKKFAFGFIAVQVRPRIKLRKYDMLNEISKRRLKTNVCIIYSMHINCKRKLIQSIKGKTFTKLKLLFG